MILDSSVKRFFSRVIPVTESGCWLWDGGLNTHGYGSFYFNGENVGAHRFSYELHRGAIPDGLVTDHACRVRCCVNPHHLTLKSNRENILCGVGATALNARKTACKRGHSFSDRNTIHRPNGGRGCRACKEYRRQRQYESFSGKQVKGK